MAGEDDAWGGLAAALRSAKGGTLLPVSLQPRASRDEMGPPSEGRLKLRLTAPPVEGRANQALLEFLSELLQTPKSRLSLAGGEKSRRKTVMILGLEPAEVMERLRRHRA